jgi:MarR family transcriptional regulator, transcriptional regulator for hemolysin
MSSENLGRALVETSRAWRTTLDKRLQPLGLSQSRWMVLLILEHHGDGMTQKSLSELLGIEGPSLVGVLDRMETDGWVERRVSVEDRRAKNVHRTGKAIEMTREIRQVADGLRAELLKGIPKNEIEQTMNLLQTLKQRFEQMNS